MFERGRGAVPDDVLAQGRRRRLTAGQVLFREADLSTSVFVCVSGRVRLVVSAVAGRELLLDVLVPGDVFGDLSAIDGLGRSASAVAMDESVVVELSGADYLDAVRASPELALSSLRGLARQLRRANARIRAGETETVAARTAHLLLELADRFAGSGPGAATVPITQSDLADWLGTTRESAARALGDLRRAGVITTGRSRIVLSDRPALVALARTA